MIDNLLNALSIAIEDPSTPQDLREDFEKEYTWFFKLYNKIDSLPNQNYWKPSEDQLEALRIAFEVGTANESWAMSKLKGLYEQLKKLREE